MLEIDHSEIERRKAYFRRVFNYQRVDHLPVYIWMMGDDGSEGYTTRADLESDERQLASNLYHLERSLRLLPDDYIPSVRITFGYMTIATLFGAHMHWSEDPNQQPGVVEPIVRSIDELERVARPTLQDGIAPDNLRRVRYFADHLPPDVHLSGIDFGGPLNNLKDLLETNLYYTAFYDAPEAVHSLLDKLTSVQLELLQAIVQAGGGEKRFACLDFDALWHPEEYISFCSDDVCATISPALYRKFSLPYNDRIYAPWGSGGFHNCGPHPCKREYLKQHYPVKYLNCSNKFTKKEYPEFRELFAGWGILEPGFDDGENGEQMVAGYRAMMEVLAPDTIAIPFCGVDASWSDSDIVQLYWEMRKVGEEYARNLRWKE